MCKRFHCVWVFLSIKFGDSDRNMLGSSFVALLIASLSALILVFTLIIVLLHIWLRTTVGWFKSDVSINDSKLACKSPTSQCFTGKNDWKDGAHNRWQQRLGPGNGERLGEAWRSHHHGESESRSRLESSRLVCL